MLSHNFTTIDVSSSPLPLSFLRITPHHSWLVWGPAIALLLLLLIACIQLARFTWSSRLRMKIIVHVLIALQMIGGLLHLAFDEGLLAMPAWLVRSLQEATFVVCSLTYLVMLLFWMNFHYKIRSPASPSSPIQFLSSSSFFVIVFLPASLYLVLYSLFQRVFVDSIEKQRAITYPVLAWHLGLSGAMTCVQLIFSVRIYRVMRRLRLPAQTSVKSKTSQMLTCVGICFVARTLSILAFLLVTLYSNRLSSSLASRTWTVSFVFYVSDQILPASAFMFLMRKVPKQKHDDASSCNSNLYYFPVKNYN